MINCIFYTLFFTLFLNMSVGSLKYSQIHRTFMSLYRGMFEACTITINDAGEPIDPYYDMTKVRNYINSYFKANLSKYTNNYKVSLTYFGGATSFVCRNECRILEISLTAEINPLFSYSKSEIFTIQDGDKL